MTTARGSWIVLLGPDGAGKSSVAEALAARRRPESTEIRHLRPRAPGRDNEDGPPVLDPHGRAPRSLLASFAKILLWLYDYIVGYWVDVRPALRRGTLVICDRYIHDVLVDPRRYRYAGPEWLVRLVVRLSPEPDLVVLLDVPSEVIRTRKQEVAGDEVVRQQQAYRDLVGRWPHGAIVSAAAPLAEVVDAVELEVERAERAAAPSR